MRAIAALLALCAGCADKPHAEPSNASCAACHAEQAARFSLSRHAAAAESPVFQALRARAAEGTTGFCDGCHAPHDDRGANERGVGCITCHAAVGNTETDNGALIADDDEARGGAHPALRPFTRASELCGTCHQVRGPGAFVETPFDEWSASPAAGSGIGCADCHLDGHAFPGVDDAPSALLAGAARVEVTAVDPATVEVRVTNANPGHAFPSGARFARDAWLEVCGVAADGAEVRWGTVSFSDQLLAGGAETADPFSADARPVRALGPAESRVMRFAAPSPGPPGLVSARARMLFRPYTPSLLDLLGQPDQPNPVTVVAEARAPLL